MVAPPPGLAGDTRFRNGSSVADCVCRLTCCFISVVDGRTRSHFALVSRSARMIELESGCTMRLVSSTERDTNGRVPGPPPFPRPSRLARRVVGVNGGACAIAVATATSAAKRLLIGWLAWATRCRLPVFVELAKTIKKFRQPILNAVEHGLSNARSEATNTHLRLLTRRSYGLSPESLIAMAELTRGGLCPPLPNRAAS
jgi:transposase